MAGDRIEAVDWIPATKRFVLESVKPGRVARKLGIKHTTVIGGIIKVWLHGAEHGRRCDQNQCVDITPEDCDSIADEAGFGRAMIEAGLLLETDTGVAFPEWYEGNNVEWGHVRQCDFCGQTFTKKGRKRYCDDRCRQRAGRQRRERIENESRRSDERIPNGCERNRTDSDDARTDTERLRTDAFSSLLDLGSIKDSPKQEDPERAEALSIRSRSEASEAKPDLLHRFDEFWETFGLKKSRKQAERAYRAAIKRLTTKRKMPVDFAAAFLIVTAGRYREQLERTGAAQKYAQGWLNDERYDDDTLSDDHMGFTKTAGEQRKERSYAAIADYLGEEKTTGRGIHHTGSGNAMPRIQQSGAGSVGGDAQPLFD